MVKILSFNQLKSLKGLPERIDGSLSINNNQLTSLEFCSKNVKTFCCSNNPLKSLEFCPEEIEEIFECLNTKIENLAFLPKKFKLINLENNPILKEKQHLLHYEQTYQVHLLDRVEFMAKKLDEELLPKPAGSKKLKV